jgi:hypothetical protein
MLYKRFASFVFFIAFCIYGCRKYDECTAISLRDGESVLLRGVWRIEKYEVNGVDSTDFILNNPYYADMEFKSDSVKGTTEGHYTAGIFKGYYDISSSEYIGLSGYDTLALSKNVLFVRDSTYYSNIIFHITCLKKNHFWVKVEYDSNHYSKHTYNHNNYYIKFKNIK